MGKKILMSAGLIVGALLYSCGGGGGGDTTPVSLYFTDAPASNFPVVEVTVYEVSLCSDPACNDKVNLFSDPNGIKVDLTDLNGVLQYVDTVNIPQGSYSRLEIILDQKARICDNTGTCNDAIFTEMDEKPTKPNEVNCPPGLLDQNGNQLCYIRYNGVVNPTANSKLVVDFDLKEFEVNTTTNPWQIEEVKVGPITPSKDHDYEIKGIIESVDPNTNSIALSWRGSIYTVNLSNSISCEIGDVYYSDATDCIAQLQKDMCVEVETYQDPSTTDTITADELEVKEAEECGSKGGYSPHKSMTEIKGKVSGVDSQNNTFTIEGVGNISVTSMTHCEYSDVYYTGTECLDNLQIGWIVEVKVNSLGEAMKIEKED